MKAIVKRVVSLEDRAGLSGGWDISKPCHLIRMDEGRDYSQALAKYIAENPDKPVADDHNVTWLVAVSPKFDEAGNMLPQPKDDSESPSLSDVLSGENAPCANG